MVRTLALLAVVITASCASALSGIEATALRLELSNGQCSATAVGPDVILSAAHCWDKGNRLLKINGKEAHALEMVRDNADHVLVRVTTKFRNHARMGPEPARGSRLTLVGNVWGIGLVRRELTVAGDVELDSCPFNGIECSRIVLIDGTTDGGDSGAGYFDARNRLVGVHTGSLGIKQHMAVMIPMKFTMKDWQEIRQ